MLSIESLNATKDLVAILADKGVSLTVDARSPLADAMAATKTYGTKLDCLGDIDKLPLSLFENNGINMVTERDEAGNPVVRPEDTIHAAWLEAASDKWATPLAGHVAHATTVVLPAVSELHDKIKQALDLDLNCGIRSYKVEMVTGSALLDVAEIYSKIEEFGKLNMVREIPLNLDYPEQTDEQLIGLLKIGSEAYDSAIDQFVAQNGIELIRKVWAVVFSCTDRVRGLGANTYDNFRADPKEGQARNFATFLFATRLISGAEGAPLGTGVSGLSAARYNMVLRSLQEVAGSALNVQVQFQREAEKRGKLIEKIDGKTVFEIGRAHV